MFLDYCHGFCLGVLFRYFKELMSSQGASQTVEVSQRMHKDTNLNKRAAEITLSL